MAGLTSEGFERLRFPEVLDEIEVSERANINENINTQDDELLGQLNNIIATALAEQWALAEAVNDNFNPLKAEGTNLDDLAAIVGVFRLDSTTSTTTEQLFTGDEGSVVGTGTLLENTNTNDRFVTTDVLAIAKGSCYSVNITLDSISDTTSYEFTVNGTPYVFLSDASATEAEILAGLKADVDADGSRTWEAVINGSTLDVTTTGLDIAVTGLVTVSVSKVTGRVDAESQVKGSISAPTGTVNILVLSVFGVDSTTNRLEYTLGTEVETDEELRQRLLVSQQVSGAATVPAIEDSVSNLAGVDSVSIVENRTLLEDIPTGRPGKSFETFVQGGTDVEIAQEIWDKKPAGIETFGNTSEDVLDSSGVLQTIFFSRPVAVNIAFRFTYSVNPEETFPVNGEQLIKDAVVAETGTLGVGVDVIPSRYFGVAYGSTNGLDISVIEIQVLTNSGDAPAGGSWSAVKQDIDDVEFASTADVDITFVVV